MTNKSQLQKALNVGTIAQIGCVVRDVSKSVENYQEIMGIGPFTTFDFKPEKSFIMGRMGNDMCLKIAIAQLTPQLSLELIEVVSGEPYHKDFLNRHGEGVQHLGFLTNEYDRVLERAEKLHITVLMRAETDAPGIGHVRGAYLDTYDKVGVLFEVLEITPLN